MKIKKRNTIFVDSKFYLEKVSCVISDKRGREHEREICFVVAKSVAGIIPISGSGKIILFKELRVKSGEYELRIPAGKIEDGETALEGAKRELREEIGLDGDFELLLSYDNVSSWVKQRISFFVATNLYDSRLPEDKTSFLVDNDDIFEVSVDELLNILNSQQITGDFAAALYHYLLTRRKNEFSK